MSGRDSGFISHIMLAADRERPGRGVSIPKSVSASLQGDVSMIGS